MKESKWYVNEVNELFDLNKFIKIWTEKHLILGETERHTDEYGAHEWIIEDCADEECAYEILKDIIKTLEAK